MPFDASSAKLLEDKPAAQAAAAPAPDDEGNPSGARDAAESLYAFLHGAADTATFGLADKASAGLASGLSQLTDSPMSYSEALAKVKDNIGKLNANSPIASGAGDVAGLVVGGAGLARGAQALTKVPGVVGRVAAGAGDALALKEGAPIANTLKTAAVGGGLSGADTALRGGSATDVALATGVGAVAAPVISKAAQVAIKTLQPASKKAMQLLATKIGESADTLERAYLNFAGATGRAPTMAELVGMKSSGELKTLASNNQIVGDAAIAAKEGADAARTTTLPQQVERITGAPPQDISSLTTARKERMTQAMEPIRDQPVALSDTETGLLSDPRVRQAVRADPHLRRRVNDAIESLEETGSAELTVNEIDAIRKSLRGQQTAYANPNSTSHNPHHAESFGQLADDIGGIATGQVPEYRAALDQFAEDSHYIKGFKHGLDGKNIGEAEKPDLIHALEQAHGQEGYASGAQSRISNAARSSESGAKKIAKDLSESGRTIDNASEALGPDAARRLRAAGTAETRAAQSLDTIAPSSPSPDAGFSAWDAGQAVAAAASHSPAGIGFHLLRAIPNLTKTLPPKQQEVVARYLLDPRMTRQGINILRRAGASNADLRRLTLSIAAATGKQSGDVVGGGE